MLLSLIRTNLSPQETTGILLIGGKPFHSSDLSNSHNSLIGNSMLCSSSDGGCASFNSLFIRSPDTVVVEKWHTRWREKEVTRTDTIQLESIRVETKEVRHVPRFYKYCAALLALVLLSLLLKTALYLYGRFR